MGEKSLRILILEDVNSDADLMEMELVDSGVSFTSKRVATQSGYLQGLEDFDPDLILSDYDLPQYTGLLALIEAKKRRPDRPFILVTGVADEEDGLFDEIMARGAHGYVLKRRLEQLGPAVKRALGLNGGLLPN
jgi:CheY-like chemotaxis protein